MRKLILIYIIMLLCYHTEAQTITTACDKNDTSTVVNLNLRANATSPSGNNTIVLDMNGDELMWSASHCGIEVVAPSRLNMTTNRGEWGHKKPGAVRFRYDSTEEYNSTIVKFRDYAIELRAYDDGVAYRFISKALGSYKVIDEVAEFAFSDSDMAWIPYVNFKPDATTDYATQFYTSFENTYDHVALKDIDWRRLMFTPAVVEHNGLKLCIVESNLEDYPGMFLSNREQNGTIDTEFATVPDIVEQGDYNMLQGVVKSRKPYIAECRGGRTFPWRGVVIAEKDEELADSRLVWNLADECRIKDSSWIKPGKVAWEWWNDWGLEGVDFKSGINNQTYKYYIDFASRYGIEYVILDEGWSVKGEADLLKVVPEIDIKELVEYGKERNVGIILWAGYWALQRDVEGLCKYYSELGVKGFKVDFLDRDDQQMVRFVYELAEVAAKYHLLVDYHGVYKPTGLQRTYPNAINFEGVHGLETMKWLGREHDQLTYDVTIPFIRAVAGPMDYTPGAMRNVPRDRYEPNYSRPMSQGTRCHQLAMYVVYDQPLAMLCDSPTAYEKEPEFTKFLASIPTTWAEGKTLSGQIGKYIVVERKAEDGTVYIAGLNGGSGVVEVDVNIPTTANVVELYRDNLDGGFEHLSLEETIRTIRMDVGGGFVVKYKIEE